MPLSATGVTSTGTARARQPRFEQPSAPSLGRL